MAKQLGMNSFRIGIEWSRVEPQNDNWNYPAIEHYKEMIKAMRERGLNPIVTLNHFTLPLWVLTPPTTFTKIIGQGLLPAPYKNIPASEPPQTDEYWQSMRVWENPKTVEEYIEFVNKIVPELKDQVDYWITLNEPVATYIGLGYLSGLWPPGFTLDGERAKSVLHNLIEAHVQAYDAISGLDNTDVDDDGNAKLVGFSHAMTFVKSADPLKLLGVNIVDNTEATNNFDYFTNDYFINAVLNGEEDLNYLNTLQRHPVQIGWKDKADFIGLNYYRALYVSYHPVVAASPPKFVGGVPLNDLRNEKQPHALLNDLGWEIYPEGLYKTLIHIKNQWNIPILITENGIADRNGDKRAPFIVSHLEQAKRAMDDGADVLGYLHWSLIDNYEWQEPYSPDSRFGLYRVDQNSTNFKTVSSDGAKALQFIICESKGGLITDSAVSKAKDKFGSYSPDGSATSTVTIPEGSTVVSTLFQFSADLKGSNEVPQISSKASGTVSISVEGNIVSYKIEVSQIDKVAAAHLHLGEDGTNGDVVATLFTSSPTGNVNGILKEGTIDSTDLEGPLKGKKITEFINLMKKNKIYVNVHTADFADGEIRGAVLASDSLSKQTSDGESQDSKTRKSYQLIVYLEGASQQNVIGDNFKIVVYNSDNKIILSAKPTIDFNDIHQKISPKNGYPINYDLGQRPDQIKVCGQQQYTLNGKSYLHDDCYPIKQNNDKTYWYTIFDYGQIDGFEAGH